jgi:dienelactone hydrolase
MGESVHSTLPLRQSFLILFAAFGAVSTAASQSLHAVQPATDQAPDSLKWIAVHTDSGVIHAAVARPSGNGPFPAVIILHGTHGFAQEYVQLARDLSAKGILSVAACWFEGGRGEGIRSVTPIACQGAPRFIDSSGSSRFRLSRLSIDFLVRTIKSWPDVRRGRVGLLGHSRGGGAALDYALRKPGTISALVLNSTGYSADVIAQASKVGTPILILHGNADNPADGGSVVTAVRMAHRFEDALKRSGKIVEAKYYDGAGHNAIFTNATQYDDAVQRVANFVYRVQGR